MTRISVDNQLSPINHFGRNVGEIIKSVLQTVPESRIVTEIILDGRQLAKHQDPEVLNHSAESVFELQIRTADKKVWARTGVDVAIVSMETMLPTLIKTAELFRENQIIRANELFSHCQDGLARFLGTLQLTKTSMKLEKEVMGKELEALGEIENEVNAIIRQLEELKIRRCYEQVSDKIECELLPNCCLWSKRLKALNPNTGIY